MITVKIDLHGTEFVFTSEDGNGFWSGSELNNDQRHDIELALDNLANQIDVEAE